MVVSEDEGVFVDDYTAPCALRDLLKVRGENVLLEGQIFDENDGGGSGFEHSNAVLFVGCHDRLCSCRHGVDCSSEGDETGSEEGGNATEGIGSGS